MHATVSDEEAQERLEMQPQRVKCSTLACKKAMSLYLNLTKMQIKRGK